MKNYWTIKIPFVPEPFATEWHPTDSKGPFSTIQRGAFNTENEAIQWAKDRLNGTPYQVQYVDLEAEDEVRSFQALSSSASLCEACKSFASTRGYTNEHHRS